MGTSTSFPSPPAHLLERESRLFSRYLVGQPANAYVAERYAAAAQIHGLALDADFSSFDRATLKVARCGHLFARWADAFCAIFHRSGALRRKLVLLSAILEHVAPSNEAFDRTHPTGMAWTVIALAGHGSVAAISLLLGTVILAPSFLICGIATRTAQPRGRQA